MPEDDRSVANLPNLGMRSAEMLGAAGITSIQQLRDMGALVAFLAVRQVGQNPSLNLLWAMEAGLQDRHWTDLTPAEKATLKGQLDSLTQ